MLVFIAHSNDDKRMARELAEKLRARDIDVFLDEDSLPAGEDYDGRIRAAIGACRVFVFLASPSSIKAGAYALTELRIARRRWPNPTGRVLPVAIGGVGVEQLPPYLTQGVTVLSPMGNAVAEIADEVDRLLQSRRLGPRRKAVLLGGSGVALIAVVSLGAASLASKDPAAPLPSTTPSAPPSSSATLPILLPDRSVADAAPPAQVPRVTMPAPAAASRPSEQPKPAASHASASPAASPLFPLPKKIANAAWVRVGADTFLPTSGWYEGAGDDEQSRLTLKIVEGKYRFSLVFDAPRHRFQVAPYRSVVDLFAAVDFRVVSATIQDPAICLLFGKTMTKDYSFCLRKYPNGEWFRLFRTDGSAVVILIDWTQTETKLKNVSRMGVLVETARIQLFMNAELVGEYRDPSYSGGKVALSVRPQRRQSRGRLRQFRATRTARMIHGVRVRARGFGPRPGFVHLTREATRCALSTPGIIDGGLAQTGPPQQRARTLSGPPAKRAPAKPARSGVDSGEHAGTIRPAQEEGRTATSRSAARSAEGGWAAIAARVRPSGGMLGGGTRCRSAQRSSGAVPRDGRLPPIGLVAVRNRAAADCARGPVRTYSRRSCVGRDAGRAHLRCDLIGHSPTDDAALAGASGAQRGGRAAAVGTDCPERCRPSAEARSAILRTTSFLVCVCSDVCVGSCPARLRRAYELITA